MLGESYFEINKSVLLKRKKLDKILSHFYKAVKVAKTGAERFQAHFRIGVLFHFIDQNFEKELSPNDKKPNEAKMIDCFEAALKAEPGLCSIF